MAQAYGEHVVYSDLNLKVEKGERVVLVGPNGAGKSTLLKILADVVPIQGGHFTPGHNVSIGYFSQQRVEVLDLSRTVLDEAMDNTASGVHGQEVRNLLGAFLFRGDDVHKPVKVLSGGEKSRLALVKLLLNPPNFLLLDEPTTHLDMASIDALIGALQDYSGTLIFVSHDVHFIRAIARSTIHIAAGKLTHYAGDYDYFLRKSEAESEQSGLIAGLHNQRPEQANGKTAPAGSMSAKERRRLNAEKRQAAKAARRHIEKRVEELEATILELEESQTELTQQLEDPATYAKPESAKDLNLKLARISKRLEETNYEWEIAAEELSEHLAEASE